MGENILCFVFVCVYIYVFIYSRISHQEVKCFIMIYGANENILDLVLVVSLLYIHFLFSKFSIFCIRTIYNSWA